MEMVSTFWTSLKKRRRKKGMAVLLNYAMRKPNHNAELVDLMLEFKPRRVLPRLGFDFLPILALFSV
jgi:hypothetical protein